MPKVFEIKPIAGIDTDTADKYVKESRARYILNAERSINTNEAGKIGANAGYQTPVPGSRLVDNLSFLPAGENTVLTSHYAQKTNETYVFVHNDQSNHFIYRINGDNTVQLVGLSPYLNFSLDPKHTMHNRVDFFYNHNSFVEAQNKVFRKYLTWTTGLGWQGFLDVETSIATNTFDIPYFETDDFGQYFQNVVRPPKHCITADEISIDPDDYVELAKTNKIKDNLWQFRIKYILTDGRPSSWGPISSAYYLRRSPCQSDAVGLPRCWMLKIPAGGPLVERIVVAFRNCNGNALDEANPTDFYRYDVINKYDKCLNEDVPFYTREIRPDSDEITYNPTDNTFNYVFCGDKECTPIDVNETNPNFTPIPITSFAQTAIENKLSYSNNTLLYDGAKCSITEKIELAVSEAQEENCQIEYATVKVAILIHNINRQVNELIFTYERNTFPGWPDDYECRFGGLMYRRTSTPFDDPTPYNQYFPKGKQGFLVYVEGTDIYARTKQYFCDDPGSNVFRLLGSEDNFDSGAHRRDISRALADRKYYIQIAELKVPKGSRGYIRLASHRADDTPGYADTSTTVFGIFGNLSDYNGRHSLGDFNTNLQKKELFFDASVGDVDMTQTPIVVADLTYPSGDLTTSIAATAYFGYLKDKHEAPVSRARVEPWGFAEQGVLHSIITDHNGFYFASFGFRDGTIHFYDVGARFFVEGAGCAEVEGELLNYGRDVGNHATQVDGVVNYLEYENKYFANVQITLKDCNNVALPGIKVVIAGMKAATTNNSGVANLVVRNRMWAYGSTYSEYAVIMQNPTCFLTLCGGGCSAVMPIYSVNFPACFTSGGNPVQIVVPAVFNFNTVGGLSRGLKPGGKYQFGYKLHDKGGRHTFIQTGRNLELTLPSVQQKGFFNFSIIAWSMLGTLNLPSWVDRISFWRTQNLMYDDYLQWVVDKVEFIDESGKETNNTAADKIRLSIISVADYNILYAGATNVRYQFVKGDRVQFIADDKGKIFLTSATSGELDFLIESNYTGSEDVTVDGVTKQEPFSKIVISYDARLKDLKEGALIQLIRPNECEGEQLFFEMCDSIDVVNGEMAVTSGIFTTFDTYQLRRAIKYNDRKNSFAFPFEHHSPSDFWGDHCDDRGRVNTKNIYEKQLQYGLSTFVSDPFLENGNYNGLGMFRENNSKFFEGESRGDITLSRANENLILFICEHDNFLSQIADDIARTGRDGVLRVVPGDKQFAEPHSKIIGNFGCQYDDVGGSCFGDGFAFYVDSKRQEPVIHDYELARSIAYDAQGISRTSSWWQKKLTERSNYNVGKSNRLKMKLVAGFDPVSNSVMLTFFARGIAADDYVYNGPAQDTLKNETVVVSVHQKEVTHHVSFTPESYGLMLKNPKGNVFFSFKNGRPWINREHGTTRYNEFFGVACDQYFTIVANDDPSKVKQFASIEVQSDQKFYSPLIITSTGQRSRIASVKPQKQNHKWNMPFLRNQDTKGVANAVHRGEVLQGYYAEVTLIKDNLTNDLVGNFDDTKRVKYNRLDSIYVLYEDVESSAFNTKSK